MGYLHHLEKTLKEIYAKGIASMEDISQIKRQRHLHHGGGRQTQPTTGGNVYSVKEAYEYLLSADTIHYKKEILRQGS